MTSAGAGRVVWAAAIAVWACMAGPAAAQSESEPQPRVYVAADALYLALYDPFNQTTTYELFQEDATFAVSYPASTRPAMSGTVAVRIWKAFSVGLSATRVQARTEATAEGTVPHPFFFDQFRNLEGRADIAREELGAHLSFRLIIPVARRFDLSVFGGPSRWRVRQDRVTELDYTSAYPFDEITFRGVIVRHTEEMSWGYNAGVDLGLYVTRHIGVGGLVQVAAATANTRATATTADTRIGGLRAGGGLRFRF